MAKRLAETIERHLEPKRSFDEMRSSNSVIRKQKNEFVGLQLYIESADEAVLASRNDPIRTQPLERFDSSFVTVLVSSEFRATDTVSVEGAGFRLTHWRD